MLAPCEITVKSVLPTIRALIAKELTRTFGLKQEETAKRLGVSQSAISHYIRETRGTALDLEKEEGIQKAIKKIAIEIYKNNEYSNKIISKLCDVCKLIRRKRLICSIHEQYEVDLDAEKCEVCLI
jgi:predicted transcriptional regulator